MKEPTAIEACCLLADALDARDSHGQQAAIEACVHAAEQYRRTTLRTHERTLNAYEERQEAEIAEANSGPALPADEPVREVARIDDLRTVTLRSGKSITFGIDRNPAPGKYPLDSEEANSEEFRRQQGSGHHSPV
jgi:hypothetical protein